MWCAFVHDIHFSHKYGAPTEIYTFPYFDYLGQNTELAYLLLHSMLYRTLLNFYDNKKWKKNITKIINKKKFMYFVKNF